MKTIGLGRTAAVVGVGLVAAGAAVLASGGSRFPAEGIDLAEMEARAQARFEAVDGNNDGQISATEFAAADFPRHGRMHGGRHMARMMDGEANDGRGRPETMDTKALFKRLDADESGAISQEELDALPTVRKEMMRTHMFSRADSNGDGVLTRDEFPPHGEKLKTLDQNSDGKLSREELRAGRSAL